jgi:hypothetical protein
MNGITQLDVCSILIFFLPIKHLIVVRIGQSVLRIDGTRAGVYLSGFPGFPDVLF